MTMSGQFYSFPRDEKTTCDREFTSIMPSYRNLAEGELNNLLVYLLSLRGE